MMRNNILQNVWKFEDIHNPEIAPSYIHRIRKCEVKHFAAIGDSLIVVNNPEENISVLGADKPDALRVLNIGGRQFNCSTATPDKFFVGTKDCKIFVYNKNTLDLIKKIDTAESVHCMCPLANFT